MGQFPVPTEESQFDRVVRIYTRLEEAISVIKELGKWVAAEQTQTQQENVPSGKT